MCCGGWLIFALPPAEVATHPTGGAGHHELYLMCDDIHATVAELEAKGVEFTRSIAEERWGARYTQSGMSRLLRRYGVPRRPTR